MKKSSIIKCLALVLAVLLACTACSNSPASNGGTDDTAENGLDLSSGRAVGHTKSDSSFTRKTAEGTLTIGISVAPASFEPSGGSNRCSQMVVDTLLSLDPETGEFIPWLANSWEYTDDYLTLTFNLRDDVYFSNGEKLTSADVYYSLYYIATTPGMSTSSYDDINWDKTNCPDDYTIVLEFDKVQANMLYTLTTAAAGTYCKSWAETATEEDWWSSPVGSGPYTVVENVSGSHTTLAAREDYWNGAAEAKTVTVKFYAESSTMFIDYETGAIDAAMDIPVNDLERVLSGSVTNTTYVVATAYDFCVLALPEYVEYFSDIRVRQAIAYALDIEALTEAAYGILGTPMDCAINNSCSYYNSIGAYEYNPEKAKTLLAEAGYGDGDITLRFIAKASDADKAVSEAVQEYLREVGITCNIETYDFMTAIQFIRAGEAELAIHGTGGGAYDAAQTFSTVTRNSTNVSTMITKDDALEAALVKGASTLDPEIRQAAYLEAETIMFEQCYYIPISNVYGAYVYRDYIESFPCRTAIHSNAWYCKFAG